MNRSRSRPGLINRGGVVSSTPTITHAYLYNTRAKLADVLAGTANLRIMCVGDSTTEGGGTGETYYNNNESYPDILRNLFIADGYDATMNAIVGYGYNDVSLSHIAKNSLFSTTSHPGISTYGGPLAGLLGFTSDAMDITFSPTGNVDEFRIWFASPNDNTASADIILDPTGTPSTTVWAPGVTGHTLKRASLSADLGETIALGTNTIKIQRTSTKNCFIHAIEAYKSAGGQVIISNAGKSASGIASYGAAYGSGVSWSVPNAWGNLDADLVIINLGINDWKDNNATAADYLTYLRNLVAGIKSTSADAFNGGIYAKEIDILLVVPNTTDGHDASAYIAAIYTVATENSLAVVDLYALYESWAVANAKGWMADDLHPSSLGYVQNANAIYQKILTA